MGGAMDLVTGAKNVYVATTHLDKKGRPKLVRKCTLPLTGVGVVTTIVTEFCVVRRKEEKMVLCEIAPEVSVEEVVANTGMTLVIPSKPETMLGI
jgi:3-oxoacid CoA-transferase subunit B/acetate CoA/acetoacetate CoA-transferase beta subunit